MTKGQMTKLLISTAQRRRTMLCRPLLTIVQVDRLHDFFEKLAIAGLQDRFVQLMSDPITAQTLFCQLMNLELPYEITSLGKGK